MAYLPTDPNQQDEDKDKQGEGAAAGPVLGAPAAAPIQGAGQSANTTQGAAPKQSRSGSFTNLMSYVNANKGNDGSMAGAIQGNVQQAANKADTAGANFTNTARQAIGQGTVKQDAGVQEGVRAMGRTATPAAAPKVDQTAFNTQYNATYAGPNSAMDVQGFGDTQAEHNKVANYGQLAGGDMADRGSLLTDVYGKGGQQYGAGERKLDSFILGAGEQGQQALQNIANDYSGYGQKFRGIMDTIGYRRGADGQGAATGLVGEGVATSDATKAAMRGIVGESETGLQGYFDPLSTEAKAKTDAEAARLAGITSGDDKALAAAGFNPEAIAFLRANPGAAAKLASAGSGWALGDLSDDSVEGNYSQLRDLLSGAGGASALPTYDFANKGGAGTQVNADILAAANDAADDWQAAIGRRDAMNARGDAAWAAIQADPLAYLRSTGNGVGGLSYDDINLLQASQAYNPNLNLRSLFTKGNAANIGSATKSQDLAKFGQLYNLLGLDQSELGQNNYGYGFSFNHDLARQLIDQTRQNGLNALENMQVEKI
jgi:hypothetical protein